MVTRCCACAVVLDRKITKLGRSSSTAKINPPSLRRCLVNIGASLFLKVRHKKRTPQFKLNVSQISVGLWFQKQMPRGSLAAFAFLARAVRIISGHHAIAQSTSPFCALRTTYRLLPSAYCLLFSAHCSQ